VSLHIWRVPVRRLPQALFRFVRDRGRLRRTPGVHFVKLLGTGDGFTPTRPSLTRWAAVIVSDGPTAPLPDPITASWRRLASTYCTLDLVLLGARGTWAGREPFGPAAAAPPSGPVLALTRARLRPARAAAFWRSVPPVAAATRTAPGLLATFGIGEAPIGWQGTVSVWHSTDDLIEFAYHHPAHRRVVKRTPTERWYTEELFARFAVAAVTGDPGVIGWRSRGQHG
jgi:hypothetical protein